MGYLPLSELASWSAKFWKWSPQTRRGRKSSQNMTARLAELPLRRQSDLRFAHSLRKMQCDVLVDYSR